MDNKFIVKVPLWQIYPGRRRFFCDGRLHTSSGWYAVPGVVALMIIPGIFHVAFDGRYLVERNVILILVPLFGSFLIIYSLFNYFFTAFTDPGFLPRATPLEIIQTEKEMNIKTDLNRSYYPPPQNKQIQIKDEQVDLKFCRTCQFYRPPRVVHCSQCNACVERFDHHCPWVSNCVGKRNHRYFYLFLVTTTFLCMYGFGVSLACFILRITSLPTGTAILESIVSIVIGVYTFFLGFAVGGMAFIHTEYLFFEQTTNESIKKQTVNPYSKKSYIKNYLYVLCGPMQPALINYREQVNEDHYTSMQNTYWHLKQELSKDDTLVAIPGISLSDEIRKRAANNNEKFLLEYRILNSPSFITKQISREPPKNEEPSMEGYEKETHDFRQLPQVKFCLEGYEETKRYVCLRESPSTDFDKYWLFVWTYDVSNIVMLFSKQEEADYGLKYNLPRETIIVNNEFIVKYDHGYRYTNFTINIFFLYSKNNSMAEPKRVNIYRYWLFNEKNLPTFSKYFVKFIRIINFNNPVHTRFFKKKKKFQMITNYPRQQDTSSMTNYLIHAQDLSRIYSFILYDYVCDEFRYTNHFAMDVVLKKLYNDAPTESRLLPISFQQHMFAYYAAFEYVISPSNDIALDELQTQINFITRHNVGNKKSVVYDQFSNILLSSEFDRFYMENLDLKSGITEFSIFNSNDLIVLNSKLMKSSETLVKLIVENSIDMIICLNSSQIEMKSKLISNLKESPIESTTKCKKQQIKFDFNNETIEFVRVLIDKYDDDNLADVLLTSVASSGIPNERILIFAEENKLTALFAISTINLRQALTERTMNIFTSTHLYLSHSQLTSADYKTLIDLNDYIYLHQIALELSTKLRR